MPATQTRAGRSDVHRPADFDPADYQVIDYLDNKRPEPPFPGPRGISADAYALYEAAVAEWQRRIFEHFPDWRTDGGDHQSIHQCNHCGHPAIRWVAVVEHVPTGDRLAFGEICAERCDLAGRDAFRAKFIKDRAALEQAAYENKMRRSAFAQDNQDVVDFLANVNDDYDSREPEFLISLKAQLGNKGELSDAQVEAARKFIAKRQERDERIAAERASLADAPPLVEGRRVIEGEVVSHKWTENRGYGSQHKMLVREADGNKVYGTVPASIDELTVNHIVHPDADNFSQVEYVDGIELRGLRVRLTGTVERSKDDDHFGFFSRPSKGEVVPQ